MLLDFILLFFVVLCGIASIFYKNLLNSIMVLGVYSLLMALLWTRYNSVDVAFTEAAVGAGITTVLLLAAMSRTRIEEEESPQPSRQVIPGWSFLSRLAPLAVVLATGAVLVYGTLDMPRFGDPNAPAHLHVAPYYIEKTLSETGVINMVTAILASYRGYDTLGEVTVIFTAGVGVILLLRQKYHG
jgi:multicomponent Na+:H+ antiporter subunit B